jgi:hypothetical protein
MKKYLPYILLVVLLLVLVGIIQSTFVDMSDKAPVPLTEATFENASYTVLGDTFTLSNGQALVQRPLGSGMGTTSDATTTDGASMPVSYTYAASAEGNLAATGSNPGAVVALYRGFGANLEWVTLAAFTGQNGTLQEIASGPVFEQDSKVQSVSVDNGVVTLNLLIVSDADQQLPHYEQTPTQPASFTFQIKNGMFVQYINQ